MRDHEIELIAALVEGRLEDPSEALAAIESSPELRDEFEAQKLAYDALRSAGSEAMIESERAALRRDVWTALRSGESRVARRTPWYYRWAPVAAGMFVVAGAVAVFSQVGGDDAMEAAGEATEAPTSDTATLFGLTEDQDLAVAEDAETAADIDGSGESTEEAYPGADDGAEPMTRTRAAFFAAEAASLRAGEMEAIVSQTYLHASASEEGRCVEEAGLEGFEAFESRFVAEDDPLHDEVGPFVVAFPEDADLATGPVAFVDLETCELLWLDD